jgi:hypothetical protein
MIDFDATLYASTYATFGVAATLDLGTSGSFTLTVIDKTAGVMLETGNNLSFGTTKPAALLRMSELAANSLTRDMLKGGAINFNGNNWTVTASQPKPNSSGAGELYLILEQA